MRLVAAVLVTFTVACTATPPAPASSAAQSDLADLLRASGFTVRDAGMVEQPFFAVPAHVLVVDGDDLQLYELASAAEADAAAAKVGPTGSTIGTSQMSWMAPPHFFRKDRTIANYLGSNPKTLAELQRRFGPQFAGQ